MSRLSMLAAAALTVMLTAACDGAKDDQAKANAAQSAANTKIGAAMAEADTKARAAQAEADKKIAEARADFLRMREDYRHTTIVGLAGVDKSVTDLEAKEKTAVGKAKTDLDVSLGAIHTARAQFGTDYASLETTTAATWDGVKATLDREWSSLKNLVDHG